MGTWSYVYNSRNQLTSQVKQGGVTSTYTYDADGNRSTRIVSGTEAVLRRTTEYAWDTWNRLDNVEVPVGGASTGRKLYKYMYDHRMRRRSMAQSGGGLTALHTAVVFSGGLSVTEYVRTNANAATAIATAAVPAVEYLRGPDMGGGVGGLIATVRSPVNANSIPTTGTKTSKYNFSSGRGDIVAQSDTAGAFTWTATYEGYGKRLVEVGVNLDKQRANSKDEDATGLLNEGFRYRDIETGVWLSRDPAGFVDGPNLYAYVKQNPWSKFDPDGQFAFVIALPALGTAVGKAALWTAGIAGTIWMGKKAIDAQVESNVAANNEQRRKDATPSDLKPTSLPGKDAAPVPQVTALPGKDAAPVPQITALPGKDANPITQGTSLSGTDAIPVNKPISTPGQQTAKDVQESNEVHSSSVGHMQRDVERGRAPREVDRVDPAHIDGGQPHIHYVNGTSSHQDGSTHDKFNGEPNPSKKTREWIEKHKWTPPPRRVLDRPASQEG